ncbi:unnamed protein product [Caenorhabditis auriculariae]|uniref:Uncharacterized protein n=1 Tax=Caenorhabditis auriculariae TaxID=2777116 RepID=A0A8S1HS94_9PELO|nr:unnamed protein product [Caenorhabditis auriculariae]
MSGNPYQKRWSSTGTTGRTTPTSLTSSYQNSVTSNIEPSTIGTSWNSVRWNKPSTSYRANLASRFENKSSYSLSPAARGVAAKYTSTPLSSAAKNAADVASVGPSVMSRASRFDSASAAAKDRYRNEARELISKWSNRERTTGESSYKPSSRYSDVIGVTSQAPSQAYKSSDSFPYRKATSLTPTRSAVPAVSRYSVERASLLAASPTPQSHTLRMERPWRQRMAESSRIRATLGDEVSAAYVAARSASRSRRGSSASQDEFSLCLPSDSALYRSRQSSAESAAYTPASRFTTSATPATSYRRDDPPIRSSYMSRSYSPVRSGSSVFRTPSTSTVSKPPEPVSRSISPLSQRNSSRESLREENRQFNAISQPPKNPSIRESSRERDAERKKHRSSRERTARRNSRQRSQQESSSEGEDVTHSRSASKRRKKRRKSDLNDTATPPATPKTSTAPDPLQVKSMQSSMYETGQEDGNKATTPAAVPSAINELNQLMLQLTAESEGFQSCATSPLAPSLSRSSSKNGVMKNQIIKSPSLVEVRGLPKSESKTSLKFNPVEEDVPDVSFSDESADVSRHDDDESQYSAVAYFRPFQIKTKRVAPVPGMWVREQGEEFISKNKAFYRQEEHESACVVRSIPRLESVEKKLKASVPVKKEPQESTNVIKKLFLGRKKKVIEARETAEKKEPVSPVASDEKKKAVPKKAETEIDKKEPVKKAAEPPKDDKASKSFAKKPATFTTEKIFKLKISVPVTHGKKIKAILPLKTTNLVEVMKKPAEKPATARKTLQEKSKVTKKASLKCKASSLENIVSDDHFRRKDLHERAKVIVDTPTKDVNVARARLRLREKRRSMPEIKEKLPELAPKIEPIPVEILPPSRMSQRDDHSRSMSRASQSRAAEVLDEMRDTEAAVEWTRDSSGVAPGRLEVIPGRPAFLISLSRATRPAKSILEEYVKRKRGRLERHRAHRPPSICSARGYESSGCDSPCNSTISELCLPSSVRVHEPSPRGVPIITAPSRRSSVESTTPVHMLDAAPHVFNNFNSTPQGFNKNVASRLQIAKPIQFDAPKSPFEERLQQQANRIRKSSVASTLSVNSDNEGRDPSPRRGSQGEGMGTISQQFTNAAAVNSQPAGRYAAHIPVNRAESSGRASATSLDSVQSGALDSATKKLDNVIDQARHRHHQHRSKFKEAIDYLDQIFEDLKKECDVNGDDKNNNSSSEKENGGASCSPEIKPAEKHKAKISEAPIASEKKTTVIKPTVVRKTSNGNSNSLPTRSSAQKHRPVQVLHLNPPSPVEVVIPVKQVNAPANITETEANVAETIVLPKKTDKLDFTRRWLHDDLASLAHMPPPNIAPTASIYQDCDEHSLGSCSAEVAAINTKKEKKKSMTNGANHKKSDASEPIRPRPFRPQPVYGVPGSSNGNGYPTEYDGSLGTSNSLPRVASFDRVSNENLQRRSGSQEPYNTLHSKRSDDGSTRPSPSAFQQVSAFPSRGSQMRASLRSLPDHSPVRPRQQQETVRDPVLAIDQLVAELELNTDQPMSASDKRMSFPTTLTSRCAAHIAVPQQQQQSNDYEQPTRQRAELRAAPARARAQGFFAPTNAQALNNNSQSQLYAQPQRPANRQQKSLDEVTTMLNNVVNQFSQQHKPVRKQTSQPFNALHGQAGQSNAFETINQEKINPSRVEAMHNMFEKNTVPTSWKMQHPQPYKSPSKEEETYYEINEFSSKPYKRVSPPKEMHATSRKYSPSSGGVPQQASYTVQRQHHQQNEAPEYVPAVPLTNPPQHPPEMPATYHTALTGSANSSQGGYYSSNSSGVGSYPQQNPRRSSIIERQSVSSRVPSMEDDDDGFYDNIGIFDDRRFSRGSEFDAASVSSRQLPPTNHGKNRIGSFLRKIGGSNNRPPGSAASLMSLNKVANETIVKPAGLMKSNSLSTEPWKKHVLDTGRSLPREANNNSQKTGLGARLKNSFLLVHQGFREFSAPGRNRLDAFTIIKHPHTTESAMKKIEDHNTLVFIVDERANKHDIKRAVKKLYNVRAMKVNTLITPLHKKKAYVRLSPDYDALDVANRIGVI